jgi:hypothetical protein
MSNTTMTNSTLRNLVQVVDVNECYALSKDYFAYQSKLGIKELSVLVTVANSIHNPQFRAGVLDANIYYLKHAKIDGRELMKSGHETLARVMTEQLRNWLN